MSLEDKYKKTFLIRTWKWLLDLAYYFLSTISFIFITYYFLHARPPSSRNLQPRGLDAGVPDDGGGEEECTKNDEIEMI